MNRIFHARIHFAMYMLVILLTMCVGWAFWNKAVLTGTAALLLLVITVERIIHTVYVLTADGRLVIDRGRFARCRNLWLADIKRVEKCRRFCVGGRSVLSYLLLVCVNDRQVAVMPVNEDEFMEALVKKRKECGTKL